MKLPSLRFPEFNKAWASETFSSIGQFYYGKSAPKWSVEDSALTPCVRYGELYSKFHGVVNKIYSYTNIPPEELKFSKGGEVLIPRVGENPLDFSLASYLPFGNIAIGEMISVFNTKQNGLYITYYIRAKLNKSFASFVEGGSVSNLYFRYLEPIRIYLPEIEEQTKIANFITAVDEKISQLIHKHDLLNQYKKGVIQQIFTQKLRFKDDDGRDFPEWDYVELEKVAAKVNKKNKEESIRNVLTNSATQGIVSQSDYFDRDIANQNNLGGYYIVETDDFVYNPRISANALVGPIKRNHLTVGVMSPLYTVFRFTKGNLDFYEQYFQTNHWHDYMKSISNTGARHDRMNITNESFFGLPLPCPVEKEQSKIVSFLNAIDDKINQTEDELVAVKQYKQGLLQQMFI